MTLNLNAAGHGTAAPLIWPDTNRQAEPPVDHPYAAATWLLGRHQTLASLAERIPGAVTVDAEGLFIDLSLLAGAITATATSTGREAVRPTVTGDVRRAASAFEKLSRSEQARLRLLAAFAGDTRVPISVGDFRSFDGGGRRLLRDWCQAVLHA